MKKIIYSLLSVLIIAVTLSSCVEDTDYETPQISCEEYSPDPTLQVEIQNILDQWIAANDTNGDGDADDYDDTENPLVFEIDSPNYIVGYVISDDKTGNFYKELYLQDDPVNPTASIKLGVDAGSLYTKYDLGRKVYVYIHDLALNKSHGEMFLGEMINNQVDEMRENRAKENIFRNCSAVDLTPVLLSSPSEISAENLGMLVQFDNMQFDLSLMGKAFVNPFDSYDSHRMITNCDDNSQIRLETSTFASFRDNQLPNMQGSVKGVLARDYGDDFYVLRVSSPDDFSFAGERCDPVLLDCNNPNTIGGSDEVYYDDFESYASYSTDLTGWTNINVNGGDTLFEVRSYSGAQYMQCSAYGTDEAPLEVWLVTPAINLDGSTNEELTFDTKTGYNNGAALSVFVSTDFTGDVGTAEWMMVDAVIANGPSSGYQSSFTSSGSVDISCLDGDVYVAFKYLGGDGGITTTFQIDNVKVTGN